MIQQHKYVEKKVKRIGQRRNKAKNHLLKYMRCSSNNVSNNNNL